jgi:hypothetical protein
LRSAKGIRLCKPTATLADGAECNERKATRQVENGMWPPARSERYAMQIRERGGRESGVK